MSHRGCRADRSWRVDSRFPFFADLKADPATRRRRPRSREEARAKRQRPNRNHLENHAARWGASFPVRGRASSCSKAAPGCFAAARKEVACRRALDHFLLELSLRIVPRKHGLAPLTSGAITMPRVDLKKCRRMFPARD